MVRLVAPDFVLRLVLAGMVNVSFVVHILDMNLDDFSADISGFGIPAYVITDFKVLVHPSFPCSGQRVIGWLRGLKFFQHSLWHHRYRRLAGKHQECQCLAQIETHNPVGVAFISDRQILAEMQLVVSTPGG